MGDRTTVQLFMYTCPAGQTWAIAEAIDRWGLTDEMGGSYKIDPTTGTVTDMGPGPFDLGYLEPGERYLGNDVSCGAADEIRAYLEQHAPDARWDVWEDPRYEWLGERVIHEPDLGTWSEECDANGQPCYPLESVTKWLDQALNCPESEREAVRERINRERGMPWLEMVSREYDKRIIAIGPDPADIAWAVRFPDGEIELAGILGEQRARMLARKVGGEAIQVDGDGRPLS